MTQGQRLGMRTGVLLGSVAWIVALGVVCVATGRHDALLPVVLPLLLASLGLGLLILTLAEHTVPAARRLCVLGAVYVAVGLLLLLAEAFVVPLLVQDAALAKLATQGGGAVRLPRWISLVALACGCGALLAGLRRGGQSPDRR